MARIVSQTINLQSPDTTSKYISTDNSGLMVYDGRDGAQTPSSPSSTTNNVFMDDDSLDIRKGTITLATFGINGSQIGQNNTTHLEMDYHSLQMIDKEGNTYFYISDLRNEDNFLTEYFIGDGVTTDFYTTFNIRSANLFINNIFIEGEFFSFEGNKLSINGAPASNLSIKIVYNPVAPANLLKSYTLGVRKPNTTIGPLSTAIGYNVQSSAQCSFAEGTETIANGNNSHACGQGTIAQGINQVVIGAYNVADTTNLFIIGNGQENARSNALTIDQSGNITRGDGATYTATQIIRW